MFIDSSFLNQSDSVYFQRALPIKELAWELISSQNQTGIWIAGPASFQPSTNDTLPFALLWKTSNKKNRGMIPESHGHLILSKENDDKVIISKLMVQDKMPLPNGKKTKKGVPKGEEEEIGSGGEMWYDIPSSTFKGSPGPWMAFAISGSEISNQIRFLVDKGSTALSQRESEKVEATPGNSLPEYKATSYHPAIPENGVRFKLGKGGKNNDTPTLFGSFSFPIEDPNADTRICALISGPTLTEMKEWEVLIPHFYTSKKDGKKSGYFTIDLKEKLKNPKLTSFDFQPGKFITFVYRGWVGHPQELDPSEIKEL